jgi:hypothetical protein
MKIKQEQIGQYDFTSSDYLDKVKSKYAPKIGRFLIDFSSLEYSLDISIVEFISESWHELGYLVLGDNSLYNKIELFRKLSQSLTKITQPKRLKRLNLLIKRFHDIRIFRNYISHANWESLEKTGYVRTKIVEKDGTIAFRKVRITPKVIESWIRRIDRLHKQFYDFVETMHDF